MKKLHFILFPLILLTIQFFLFKDTNINPFHNENLTQELSGDLAINHWALMRSLNHPTKTEFYNECQYSNKGCMRFDAVPFEWNFYLLSSKIMHSFNLSPTKFINLVYYFSISLNIIIAYIVFFYLLKDFLFAFSFSIPVAFHYSVIARTTLGHLLLALIAPSLILLVLYISRLRNIEHFTDFRSKKYWFSSFLIFLSFFPLMNFSFSYTLLTAILCIGLTLFYYLKKKHIWTKKIIIPLFLPIVLSLIINLSFNTHLFFGANGVKDADIFNRKPIGVSLYSARIPDFFRPTAGTLIQRLFHLNQPLARGEVYSFLGTGLLLVLLICLFSFLKKSELKKENIKKVFKQNENAFIFSCMSLFTFFYNMKLGGYTIFYTLSKGVRSYNRMAPFTVFFFLLAIGTFLQTKNKKFKYSMCSLIFIFSLWDTFHIEPIEKLKTYTASKSFVNEEKKIEMISNSLESVCHRGIVELSPEFKKVFLDSQWVPLYLIEKNKCPNIIGGPYQTEFPKSDISNLQKLGKFTIKDDTYAGIEHIEFSNN